jgi:iron complex transport system substrate-binding protein
MTDAKDLPVVGNYLDVHTEKLLKLKPTHVLMMTGKNGTPQSLVDLSNEFGFKLLAYDYPESIFDLTQIITHMGVKLNMESQAFDAAAKMHEQLTKLSLTVMDFSSQNVLPIIGTEPIMASGSGTVINELISQLGCNNVAASSPVSAPTYDREKLVTLNPDVILLLKPDAPALENGLDDPRLAVFHDLPINAVKNKRVYLINDPLTFLPATSLARVAKQMALAIYPQLSDTAADAK